MIINLTEWATDSYFDLVVGKSPKIGTSEYKAILRPDVEIMRNEKGLPLQNPKFQNHKFWGPAKSKGVVIPHGFKMKWHNFGSGKVQLRLCVAVINNECFLCQAYVKDDKTEKRQMANFKVYVQRILGNNYPSRGVL